MLWLAKKEEINTWCWIEKTLQLCSWPFPSTN